MQSLTHLQSVVEMQTDRILMTTAAEFSTITPLLPSPTALLLKTAQQSRAAEFSTIFLLPPSPIAPSQETAHSSAAELATTTALLSSPTVSFREIVRPGMAVESIIPSLQIPRLLTATFRETAQSPATEADFIITPCPPPRLPTAPSQETAHTSKAVESVTNSHPSLPSPTAFSGKIQQRLLIRTPRPPSATAILKAVVAAATIGIDPSGPTVVATSTSILYLSIRMVLIIS